MSDAQDTQVQTCIVCGRNAGKGAVVYQHTEKEQRILSALLVTPTSTVYCSACDRIMRDREQAAQLFKGLELTRCRALGVPLVLAEQHAERAYQFYLAKSIRKQVS
jgi:hypothetical protein